MSIARLTFSAFLSGAILCGVAAAQESAQAQGSAGADGSTNVGANVSASVSATASASGVRFVSNGATRRVRLEVYGASGARVRFGLPAGRHSRLGRRWCGRRPVPLRRNGRRFSGLVGATRHLGPMAEDFYSAFRLGVCNTSIGVQDAVGVSFAAVKALEARTLELQQKTEEVEQLRAKVNSLERRLAALEQLVEQNPKQPYCQQK